MNLQHLIEVLETCPDHTIVIPAGDGRMLTMYLHQEEAKPAVSVPHSRLADHTPTWLPSQAAAKKLGLTWRQLGQGGRHSKYERKEVNGKWLYKV